MLQLILLWLTQNLSIRMCLFESFALPLLTYGLNVLFLSGTQLSKLNSSWNNVYRKIFGMKPWESVKEIQIFCGRLNLKHLIDLSKMKFLNNVSTSPIRVLQCCISQAMRSASAKKLFYCYGVYTGCCVSFNTVYSKLKCALVV